MKPALLDVNVLLALAWPNHQHHRAAQRWLSTERARPWATCPLTELAFVRLSSNPAFTPEAVRPADALRFLGLLRRHPRHRGWQELPQVDDLAELSLLGHQQVADAYLLLVARKHRGLLATFDRRLASIAGAADHVLAIAP